MSRSSFPGFSRVRPFILQPIATSLRTYEWGINRMGGGETNYEYCLVLCKTRARRTDIRYTARLKGGSRPVLKVPLQPELPSVPALQDQPRGGDGVGWGGSEGGGGGHFGTGETECAEALAPAPIPRCPSTRTAGSDM